MKKLFIFIFLIIISYFSISNNTFTERKENITDNVEQTQSFWNNYNESFSKSKKILENNIFNNIALPRISSYCSCEYNKNKVVNSDSCSFLNNWKYESRSKKIEWEHVVPAHAFWQYFNEWNNWHKDCVDSKGKKFKWRNCVEKINKKYRLMQSDLYNLLPVIGSVNAQRSNYSMTQFTKNTKNTFGGCTSKIINNKFEPQDSIKWDVARIYMYMEQNYPGLWIISNKNQKLFLAWDKLDPIDEKECNKNKIIEGIQWNINFITYKYCKNFNK